MHEHLPCIKIRIRILPRRRCTCSCKTIVYRIFQGYVWKEIAWTSSKACQGSAMGLFGLSTSPEMKWQLKILLFQSTEKVNRSLPKPRVRKNPLRFVSCDISPHKRNRNPMTDQTTNNATRQPARTQQKRDTRHSFRTTNVRGCLKYRGNKGVCRSGCARQRRSWSHVTCCSPQLAMPAVSDTLTTSLAMSFQVSSSPPPPPPPRPRGCAYLGSPVFLLFIVTRILILGHR